jgi:hypothetical protein
MSVSTLTLALSKFNELDIRANAVNKAHPDFYHIYYVKDHKQRVMQVPKRTEDMEKLQREVGILLQRSFESQVKYGAKDRV